MSRVIIDSDFTGSDLSSSPSFQLVNLYDLIALPKEAEEHINSGHMISAPKPNSSFSACSCGLSFRVGIIVDSKNVTNWLGRNGFPSDSYKVVKLVQFQIARPKL